MNRNRKKGLKETFFYYKEICFDKSQNKSIEKGYPIEFFNFLAFSNSSEILMGLD